MEIWSIFLILIVSNTSSGAQQEAILMTTIVNKSRFFTLRHRLHQLSHTIQSLCNMKLFSESGEIILPELEESGDLHKDLLRQSFLEDRWATLIFIHQTLTHYDKTESLVLPQELLREITSTTTEYEKILEEEKDAQKRLSADP